MQVWNISFVNCLNFVYCLKIATEFQMSGESQGLLLSEIHFSAKLKILILNLFWSRMPLDPLNGLGLTVELNIGLEKSGNFILYGSGNQSVSKTPIFSQLFMKLRV